MKNFTLLLSSPIHRYERGNTLAGVLYFHRISNFRMGGISTRNFNMFRKLCGDSTLQNVVIITNMWGEVDPQVGGAREAELVREDIFFKPVLDKGAQIARRTRYHRSRKTSPDLSQNVKVSDSLVGYAVKHKTTSPVIVPVDNDQPMEDNPPTQLLSRSVSSMSTSAPAPVPALLPTPPHLPQKPVTLHSKPPVPIQQSGQSPRRCSTQRSRSRSRSSSPHHGSPSPRMPSRASRSSDAARGCYKSPPTSRRMVNYYSPPCPSYCSGGSRYEHDSRSNSPPPPPPPNSRKRALQVSEDSRAKASTPSKSPDPFGSLRRREAEVCVHTFSALPE